MYRSSTSLLTRLRRHRGLWVLAVAVMLIKLTAGTFCLTDGQGTQFASAATTIGTAVAMNVAVDNAPFNNAGGCVLGEVACHCVCAHTVTLPTAALLSIARVDARFDALVTHSGFMPALTGSLIRPPIA